MARLAAENNWGTSKGTAKAWAKSVAPASARGQAQNVGGAPSPGTGVGLVPKAGGQARRKAGGRSAFPPCGTVGQDLPQQPKAGNGTLAPPGFRYYQLPTGRYIFSTLLASGYALGAYARRTSRRIVMLEMSG